MVKFKKLLAWTAVGGLFALVAAEIGLRFSGIGDFPIYQADEEIGYQLAPNQTGAFLGRNRWVFNEKSLGASTWRPELEPDILLLGDSIVLGGNPLDQPEKLGPQIAARLPGVHVWPASAGSWAVPNEIAYLKRFPEVVRDAETVVWLLNTGDFDAKSTWKSESTHPRSRPVSVLAYVFSKYFWDRFVNRADADPGGPVVPRILPESVAALQKELAQLKAARPERAVLFVLYPGQTELSGSPDHEAGAFYATFHSVLAEVAKAGGAEVLDVRQDPRWGASRYRDGIHPSAEGDAILAEIIAEKVAANSKN